MTNKQYENIGRLAEQWLICMDGLERIHDNLEECYNVLCRFMPEDSSDDYILMLANPNAGFHAPTGFFETLRVIISNYNMKEIMKEKEKEK